MFNNVYNGKKVLITGNTGFKGSWLTVWLLKLGADVHGMSNEILEDPSNFTSLKLHKKITCHYNDIRDLKKTKAIIEEIKPDFIFHLAAQAIVSKSYYDPIKTLSTNVMGTANILESMRSLKKCVGVIITSDKCYDNVGWTWGYRENDKLGGKDIYSGSKACAEMVINSYYNSFFKDSNSNIRISSARAGNVIGGGDWAKDRIIPDCIRSWADKKSVTIRSPNATRPWQHVLEPLSGYLSLGQNLSERNDFNGKSFNFGPSANTNKKVIDLITDISEYFDNCPDEPYELGTQKFHESSLLKLNCDMSFIHLDWQPTLLYEETVNYTGSWYKMFLKNQLDDSVLFSFTSSQIDSYCRAAKGAAWTK